MLLGMGAGVKHNILLVDDDELIQRSITMFLKDEGFFVKSVSVARVPGASDIIES
nr:hypothetical protein HAGR004_40920 [Bdellovibrio sp. HAGR004]